MVVTTEGKEITVVGKWIEELLNDPELTKNEWKVKLTRAEAIEHLTRLQEDNDDFDVEPYNFPEMSNTDLENELCSSGMIHDNHMDTVVDG